jgi:hypothetical protein
MARGGDAGDVVAVHQPFRRAEQHLEELVLPRVQLGADDEDLPIGQHPHEGLDGFVVES